MSSAYDQQIKQLVDHIQTLNQALHERNMQIVHWQEVARAVQDERARLARGLMDQVKTSLGAFSTRFQGLRAENKKLRAYIEHQKQLHESVARDLQGQLQYALARIDELARERSDWRGEVSVTRQAALKYQQQVAEQKGVITSQQAALTELRNQLAQAQGFAEVEERLRAESEHLEHELERVLNELHTQDALVAARDRELRSVQEAFEAFRVKANEEVAALNQELGQHRNQVVNNDERVDELTGLLANSEREVVNLHKSLGLEREKLRTAEVQLEAALKDNKALKRKVTMSEKAKESAKGQTISSFEKQLEIANNAIRDLREANERLQKEMTDKTQYMQAIEGQKGKLRAVPPPAEQGQ
jgi:chromosome segregation ATPase